MDKFRWYHEAFVLNRRELFYFRLRKCDDTVFPFSYGGNSYAEKQAMLNVGSAEIFIKFINDK